MKILLLGGGGREHALAWKIAQSEKCEKLFIAPGNAGTQNVGENVNIKADGFVWKFSFDRRQLFPLPARLVTRCRWHSAPGSPG